MLGSAVMPVANDSQGRVGFYWNLDGSLLYSIEFYTRTMYK